MSGNGRIDYYFWHMSDWAYFGHPRLEQIADRQGVSIDYMPVDLTHVYTRTGGILLPLRAKERQDYRFFELKRFREQLGIPLNLEPKFFPVSGDLASCVTIAAKRRGLPLARLVPAMMRAVWAEDRDVSDAGTQESMAWGHATESTPIRSVQNTSSRDQNNPAGLSLQPLRRSRSSSPRMLALVWTMLLASILMPTSAHRRVSWALRLRPL